MPRRKKTSTGNQGERSTARRSTIVVHRAGGDASGDHQPQREGVLPADEFFDRISQREDIKAILRRLAE
jgi:hypothetical protein